jgi:hypothetical protein
MCWGSWKSMGPRRAWSHGPGRAGHPAASVGRNPRAGLNQRPAPPRHGGTWRDPVWGGFVLRRYFGEPPHKTGRPNPPRRPATQNYSNLGHSASSSWAATLAGAGTVTARSSSASWSTRGRPVRQVCSAPARRRATPLSLRRWAESGCSPPRPPPRTPPSGRSPRPGVVSRAKPSATPGVITMAATHPRRHVQYAQTLKRN